MVTMGILNKLLGKKDVDRKMHFGPNRVITEVRRALRDDEGNPLYDEHGDVMYSDRVERFENFNIACSTGLDAAKDRLFNNATTQTIAEYIALTLNTAAPAAASTLLAAEITGSGLARALATYSVAGCTWGECILSKTFTANATVTAVVKMALLDAAAAGDLYFEATIASVSLESADQLTAKWDKITLS